MGPAGTGKTFTINTIIDGVHSRARIAIVCSSSGISALLLRGGRTAHSTFRIPVHQLDGDSICALDPDSETAGEIRDSALTVWDDSLMQDRHCFEAVDRLYRDICRRDVPFGGKVVLFGGDPRQILSVVPGGSTSHIIAKCITSSPLWRTVRLLRLEINMRVEIQAAQGVDVQEQRQFAEFLAQVGDGQAPGYEPAPQHVRLPTECCIPTSNSFDHDVRALINAVFPDLARRFEDPSFNMASRCILAARNNLVEEINDACLALLPGDARELLSVDDLNNEDGEGGDSIPIEALHQATPGGLPPHRLLVKPGMPVILLRNIDASAGLCNGTRLIVQNIRNTMLACRIATGTKTGQNVFLSRMAMEPSPAQFPVKFKRTQFPVRPAFAMTINKAQGQTLGLVEICLKDGVLTHGLLYVALSRVGSPHQLRILCDFDQGRRVYHAKNIVFAEIIRQFQQRI